MGGGGDGAETARGGRWSRRPESNRDLALRRRSFYPLNYGEAARILRDAARRALAIACCGPGC